MTPMRIEATRSSLNVSPLCINEGVCSPEGLDATCWMSGVLYATAQKTQKTNGDTRRGGYYSVHDVAPASH